MNAIPAIRWQKLKKQSSSFFVTGFAVLLLAAFLMPFLYMLFTSVKTFTQMTAANSPIWPAANPTYVYQGQNKATYTFTVNKAGFPVQQVVNMNDFIGKTLQIYSVPLADGSHKNLALLLGYNKSSIFLDPQHPAAAPIVWTGFFKALPRPWTLSPTWSNFLAVWNDINYPRVLGNTFFYAITTTIGVLISCTVVAFGFSRFRFPGRDLLFVVMIATLFLPATVTIIPTFTFFVKIHWVGTWLPLIVPTFFANPYDTFLLRQYFMTLPRELDEAAMMDGASPLRILWSVILPQSWPVIVAVTVFHVVYAWNDYFGPLIYLSTNMNSQPVSVALARFNGIYGQQPQLIQAGALMTLIIPLILFFLAQRFFVQGIVITGVEK
ncbi:MAG: carbohydrate ABC transporter permease [Anaerolineales bacterium]|jgi:multiple sugar transport system permease protein